MNTSGHEHVILAIIFAFAFLAVAMLFISIGVAMQENKETKLMNENCNGKLFVRNNSVFVCAKVSAEVVK